MKDINTDKHSLKEKDLAKYMSTMGDIELAMIFGSVAEGRANKLSDLDIAVLFVTNSGDDLALSERQVDITTFAMGLFSMNDVDVVILNTANPFLKYQVFKTGRLIYARDIKTFYRFKAMAFADYIDIKPLYDHFEKRAMERLKGR